MAARPPAVRTGCGVAGSEGRHRRVGGPRGPSAARRCSAPASTGSCVRRAQPIRRRRQAPAGRGARTGGRVRAAPAAPSVPASPAPARHRPAQRELHRRRGTRRHVPDRPTRRPRARALRADAGQHEATGCRSNRCWSPCCSTSAPSRRRSWRKSSILLNDLGVEIEPFGGASYLVRTVPADPERRRPAEPRSPTSWTG